MFLPQSDQISHWDMYICGVELQFPAFLTSALDDDDEWSAQSPQI